MDVKDISQMPPLPGDLREIVLFTLQDAMRRLNQIEEMLCLSEEEESNGC